MTNVVTLITSPRKDGCEAKITEKITEGIEENDGDNEVLFLNDYILDPCQACNTCRDGPGCVQDDDFEEITEIIREADVFIFLAPIFFSGISGQSKMFLDRFYAIGMHPEKAFDSKKTELIFTYSSKQGDYEEYCKTLDKPFVSVNLDVDEIWDVGELLLPDMITAEVLEKAKEMGKSL
jgi:multimeric flavodoxin WrbA